MSLDSQETAILSRFNSQWNENDAAIAWPNFDDFDIPPDDRSPWVRINIMPGESFGLEISPDPFYRYPGVIIGQIFTAIGIGPGAANRLADKFADVFRGQTFSGVVCHQAYFNRLGRTEDNWYQVNCLCEYYFDNNHL